MAILRHEKQEYANAAALVAETVVPTANDSVYIEDLNRTFDWILGSTTTADNSFVIDQTTQTAVGRWIASSVANVFTGTVNTDAMDNGQISIITATVTGADPASANLIAITNANTFPANVFITASSVTAANTVRIVVENQSGSSQIAFAVNITVLEF